MNKSRNYSYSLSQSSFTPDPILSKILSKPSFWISESHTKIHVDVPCFFQCRARHSIENIKRLSKWMDPVAEETVLEFDASRMPKDQPDSSIEIKNFPLPDETVRVAAHHLKHSRFRNDDHIGLETSLRIQSSLIMSSAEAGEVLVSRESPGAFMTLESKFGGYAIGFLFVPMDYRGQGIGTKLLHKAMFLAVERNSRLYVRTQNSNTSAIGLYRKVGFLESELQMAFHLHTG